MRARFDRTASGASATLRPGKEFEGFGGVLQGGIVAGLMDDAMWYAIFGLTGKITMTVELTIRYKAPVPVETALTVSGELVEQRRSLYSCRASIRDTDGTVLAEATGKFMPAPEPLVQRLERELS